VYVKCSGIRQPACVSWRVGWHVFSNIVAHSERVSSKWLDLPQKLRLWIFVKCVCVREKMTTTSPSSFRLVCMCEGEHVRALFVTEGINTFTQ
jgi:hypothetical protein